MRRLLVLGCTLVLVAGCGGGGGSAVDETVSAGLPAPVSETTLHTTGERPDAADGGTTVFYNWGVWGGVLRDDVVACTAIGCPPAGDAIFWAYLTSETGGSVTTTVTGTPSGTSPMGGNTVWIGDVHAFETETVATSEATSVTRYVPVEGDARLEVDFTAVTVDVEFTNFDSHRAELSWSSLIMDGGAFGNVTAGLEGSFYGADHEGAAGTFQRDGLTGVFGALRSSE